MGLRAATVLVLALGGAAHAADTSVMDLQLLYGGPFDDFVFGNRTASRQMYTLTLEYIADRSWGDSYFYVDFLFGDFVDRDGARSGHLRFYSEWHPRLSLGKAIQKQGGFFGVLADLFVAGQLNVGSDGYWAYLIGGGVNLKLPRPYLIGANAYARKDGFNRTTYQVTAFWELPFGIRPWQFCLRGYVDVFGTDRDGVDVNAQPQLLFDLGPPSGLPRDKLQVGVEHYFHWNQRILSNAAQAMLRWIW